MVPHIDQLPVFEDIDDDRIIGEGSFGTVYAINGPRQLVAKIWKERKSSHYVFDQKHIQEASWEYHVASELYTKSISVPKPEGVFAISLPSVSPVPIPAFIMEQVRGETYWDLSFMERIRATQLYDRELERVRGTTDLIPFDCYPDKNCLYQLGHDKIILFDFGEWRRGSPEYLDDNNR